MERHVVCSCPECVWMLTNGEWGVAERNRDKSRLLALARPQGRTADDCRLMLTHADHAASVPPKDQRNQAAAFIVDFRNRQSRDSGFSFY